MLSFEQVHITVTQGAGPCLTSHRGCAGDSEGLMRTPDSVPLPPHTVFQFAFVFKNGKISHISDFSP